MDVLPMPFSLDRTLREVRGDPNTFPGRRFLLGILILEGAGPVSCFQFFVRLSQGSVRCQAWVQRFVQPRGTQQVRLGTDAVHEEKDYAGFIRRYLTKGYCSDELLKATAYRR